MVDTKRFKEVFVSNDASAVGNVFNTAVLVNTDIFTPVSPAVGLGSVAYRISIGLLLTDSIVNVQIDDGVAKTGFDLQDGTALTAGRLYTFTWGAHSDYSYSIQCETATTIGYCLLEEVRGAVI